MKIYLHKHGVSLSPTKKANGVQLHDLSGQLITAYLFQLYGMWHRLVESTYSPSRILQKQEKNSQLSYNHHAPNWRWQSFHRRFQRSKVHLRTKERTRTWLFLDVMTSIQLLEDSQNHTTIKYFIMCRKTILIPENDEELTR